MKKINVIIIDDEANILNALKRVFRKESFAVLFTKDHNEVFKVIEQEKIKVVISDHKMTNMFGLDFLAIIKQRYPKVIRILFTGYSNLQIIKDAVANGQVYKVIDKPWDDEGLRQIVHQAIEEFDLKDTD